MSNFKKYLPSKKFLFNLAAIIILISVFFLVKWGISLLKKNNKQEGNLVPITVGSIAQKDSNSNGIADWEEYLWGLDPNKNGPENKEFILSKKKSLEQNGVINKEDESKILSQNETLSRQFFATILSLQQTGNLDESTISSLSEAIGQEIKMAPIPDKYTKEALTIKPDSKEAKSYYFNAFMDLMDRYEDKDIGGELTIMAQGIVTNDPQALYSLKTIATAYRDFGRDLLKIPTPSSAANINLSLANNYEKTAQSIEGLSQGSSDPLIGMRSILNYKKYTDGIVSDIEKLRNALQ